MKKKHQIFLIQLFILFVLPGTLISQSNFSDNLMLDSLYGDTKTRDPEKKIKAFLSLADFYFYSDPDSAEKYLNKGLIISKTYALKENEVQILKQIGILYNEQGNIDNAIKFFRQSLEIAKSLNDTLSVISAVGNMGNSYMYSGNYKEAIKNFTEVLNLSQERNDNLGTAKAYGSLGNLYIHIENYEKALSYYILSKEKFEDLNNEIGIALSLMNISIIYCHTEKYDNALENYSQANRIFINNNNYLNSAKCLSGISKIYSYKGDYKKSIDAEFKALKIYKDYEANFDIVNSYSFIASNEIYLKNYKRSINFLDSVYETAVEKNYYSQLERITDCYRMSYDSLGDYKKAYYYSVLNKSYYDSIFNIESDKKFSELEIKFETSQKEQQIELYKKNEEILNKENRNRLITAGALILLLILASVIFFLIYNRAKLKAKQKNIEIEQKLLRIQMNPHFIFNALSAVESFMYKNDLNQSALYLSNFAKLMRLILESSRKNLISLDEELQILNYYIEFQKLRNKIDFNYEINVSENIDIENTLIPPMLIQPFIENTIEHGFSDEISNALLEISFNLKNNYIFIDITDNGKGIKSTKDPKTNHQSLAIQITKERLSITAGKKHKNKINFSVQDLTDIDSNLRGTKVSIKIPHFEDF